MNEKDYDFKNETGTWQTGRTQPPKHYGGLVAFLIALVILLSGISTALSIMNFKLYRTLTTQETAPPVAFSRVDGVAPQAETVDVHEEELALQAQLGITGTIIPKVYQRYYKLPNGLYVTQIQAGSEASEKGLMVGDIITKLDEDPIQDSRTLTALARKLQAGDTVVLTVYRSGSEHTVPLTWDASNSSR